MRQAAGQGIRHAGRLVHGLLRLALALTVLAAAALGVLSWRLSHGPLALPWLVPYLESALADTPYRLSVADVALTWEGAGERLDRPLDLRLRQVVLWNASGARILRAPSLEVSLSLLSLLRGQIRPRAVDIDGLHLRAWRRADGSAALDLASADAPPPDAPAGQATPQDGPAAGLLEAVLSELAHPPDSLGLIRRPGRAEILSALRRVRLRNAVINVVDRQFNTVWHASQAAVDLRRRPHGGMDATAAIVLDLAGRHLAFNATAMLQPAERDAPKEITFSATLPPLVPATLAQAVPRLKPLEALDAEITLTLSGQIDTALQAPQLQLRAEIGPGTVHLGRGTMPLRSASLVGQGTLDEFDLRVLALNLAPPPLPGATEAGPTTLITGWLHARRDVGWFDAAVSLTLDHVDFADLPALWPVGVGGPGTRRWVAENVTAGEVRNLHLALALRAPEDLSKVAITWIDGAAEGHDLTVHWLRPVPPIEHGEATLSITSADALRIDVLSGIQSPDGKAPGALRLTGGKVVLSGLTHHDQFADIDGDITGPLPDVLTLLRHPRIKLLSRRPLPLHEPAGQVSGQLTVSHLPLKEDLSLDELRIQATARLTGVHLGGIAAGHDLDHGTLAMEAGNDGLSVQGEADLGGIPSKLQVQMDFRGGPPDQVIQKVSVSGTPTAAQLAAVGLAMPDVLSGTVGVHAEMTSRRNGHDAVAVQADLTTAGLDAPRLHWSKPVGQPAKGEVEVLMRNSRITALEGLRVEGSGLDLRGRMAFTDGRPHLLQLHRLALGGPTGAPATDVAGTITWPDRPGAPWLATLDGPSVDAAGEFTRAPAAAQPAQAQPAAAKPGAPWRVDARVGRVLLGDRRALAGVVVKAENNGQITTSAQLSGRTVAPAGVPGAASGRFELSLTPRPGGRVLSGSATDAGGLLRAFGVVDDMYGGQMMLSARYDDTKATHPLAGDIRITDYRMRNAPVLARLLQALSGYGIVTALESPDLAFAELVAPFRLSGDTLELFQARTYNASLGMTAKGRLDLARRVADVEGTIVPAYFLNSLLGRLPLIGKLLSPERGGGLFALNYTVRGSLDDPSVTVNPLSAVTPGFLRGLFGVFAPDSTRQPGANPAAPVPPGPAPAGPTPPGANPPAAWGGTQRG